MKSLMVTDKKFVNQLVKVTSKAALASSTLLAKTKLQQIKQP